MTDKEAVVLGALLHDVGKFWQRTSARRVDTGMDAYVCPPGGTHVHAVWTYRFFEELGAGTPGSTGQWLGLARDAAAFHHNPRGDKPAEKWVQRADRLASAHDRRTRENDEQGDHKKERLYSLFPRLTIGDAEPPASPTTMCYPLKPLNWEDGTTIFAEEYAKKVSQEKAYDDLWEPFRAEMEGAFHGLSGNFDRLITRVFFALKRFTWAIPSSTRKDEPDISLFDHSRVTAALAACLAETGGRDEYLLIEGDVSGIQRFIADVQTPDEARDGASKRMRGRSFWLSLLTESVAQGLTRTLGLWQPNILWSGGGHCLIIAPDTEGARQAVKDYDTQIQQWLWREYHGKLTFNVGVEPVTGEELCDYPACKRRVSARVAEAKARKLSAVIFNPDEPLTKQLPASAQRDICRVCGRDWIPSDGHKYCERCEVEEKLGGELAHAKWITRVHPSVTVSGRAEVSFAETGAKWVLTDNPPDDGVRYRIGSPDSTGGEGFWLMAQRLPAKEGSDEPMTFEEMAKAGQEKFGGGISRLAVLRMDVDNLGSVFSRGFKKKDPKTGKEEDEASISRMATLSSQLDLFFSGYLTGIVEKESKSGYITYSGGDDLYIVAHWQEAIAIAKAIRKEFHKYSCERLTISAGLSLFKQKFPVAQAGENAQAELEEVAKQGNKNACALFGRRLTWEELDEVLREGDELVARIEKGDLARGFPYRMLTLAKQKMNDVRYVGILRYLIRRNVKDSALQQHLENVFGKDKWKEARIPVLCNYTSLRIRRGREEG